jgi:hypothetical protein
MAAWRSIIERNTPRRRHRFVSVAKKVLGLVAQEAVHARMHKALLPTPHAGVGQPRVAHDLHGLAPVSGGQDHLGAGDVFELGIAIASERLQVAAILRSDGNLNPSSHPETMDRPALARNPPNAPDH